MRRVTAMVLGYALAVLAATLGLVILSAIPLLAQGNFEAGVMHLRDVLPVVADVGLTIAVFALPGFVVGRLALWWADLEGKVAYAAAGGFAGLLPVLAITGFGALLLFTVPVGIIAALAYRAGERFCVRLLAGPPRGETA